MDDLIDRAAAVEGVIEQLEFEWGYEGIREDVQRIFNKLPAVDAVEVQAIEKWLYKIAMNNVGQPVEDMAAACEIIISRLDGLRWFAKERREENGCELQAPI